MSNELREANDDEICHTLGYALTRRRDGKRVRDDHIAEYMQLVSAERLLEHLKLSGFVIMKRPPCGGTAPGSTGGWTTFNDRRKGGDRRKPA